MSEKSSKIEQPQVIERKPQIETGWEFVKRGEGIIGVKLPGVADLEGHPVFRSDLESTQDGTWVRLWKGGHAQFEGGQFYPAKPEKAGAKEFLPIKGHYSEYRPSPAHPDGRSSYIDGYYIPIMNRERINLPEYGELQFVEVDNGSRSGTTELIYEPRFEENGEMNAILRRPDHLEKVVKVMAAKLKELGVEFSRKF